MSISFADRHRVSSDTSLTVDATDFSISEESISATFVPEEYQAGPSSDFEDAFNTSHEVSQTETRPTGQALMPDISNFDTFLRQMGQQYASMNPPSLSMIQNFLTNIGVDTTEVPVTTGAAGLSGTTGATGSSLEEKLGKDMFKEFKDALVGFGQALFNALKDTPHDIAERQAYKDYAETKLALNRQLVDMANKSTIMGLAGQMYGERSRRLGEQAEQSMNDDVWEDMRDWSMRVAGMATALGIFAGTYSPGDFSARSTSALVGLGEGGAEHLKAYNDFSMDPNSAYSQWLDYISSNLMDSGDASLQFRNTNMLDAFRQSMDVLAHDLLHLGGQNGDPNNPAAGLHSGELFRGIVAR